LVLFGCCILRLRHLYGKNMSIIPKGIDNQVEFRYELTKRILVLFTIATLSIGWGGILVLFLTNNRMALYLFYIVVLIMAIMIIFTIVMFIYFLSKKKGRELLSKEAKNY